MTRRAAIKQSQPDPQILRMISTARAAGLGIARLIKRGREVTLEFKDADEREADDIDARIARMASHAE